MQKAWGESYGSVGRAQSPDGSHWDPGDWQSWTDWIFLDKS